MYVPHTLACIIIISLARALFQLLPRQTSLPLWANKKISAIPDFKWCGDNKLVSVWQWSVSVSVVLSLPSSWQSLGILDRLGTGKHLKSLLPILGTKFILWCKWWYKLLYDIMISIIPFLELMMDDTLYNNCWWWYWPFSFKFFFFSSCPLGLNDHNSTLNELLWSCVLWFSFSLNK